MTNPTISADERARLLINEVEQLLMQREHKEAEFVARRTIRQAEQAARGGFAAGLFEATQHGDEEHKAWLKQAIKDYVAGRPVERPRGKGTKKAIEQAAYERAAKVAKKCAEQNRQAEIDCARRGDDIGHDVLAACRHEAEAIAAKISALAQEPEEVG